MDVFDCVTVAVVDGVSVDVLESVAVVVAVLLGMDVGV